MKLPKKTLSFIIVLLAALVYGSDAYLGTEFLSFLEETDSTAPVIDVANIPRNVRVGQSFDIEDVACSDDIDETCEVIIDGSVDSSIIGEYTVTYTAVDQAGNETVEVLTIIVVDNIDTTFYVPAGYYDSIQGLTGNVLKDALNDIITGHTEYPYTDTDTDVWDILKEADQDPNNPDNIIAFYSGISIPKECQQDGSVPDYCEEQWNREHIWSKSRGDFEIKEGTSTVLDMGAHTDIHHLVAAERTMNSLKNNRLFEDCNDGDDTSIEERDYGNFICNNEWVFEPRDEVKGDVARMIFYMAVRYEGEEGDMVDLEVLNNADPDKSIKLPYYGDLDDLLRWHIEDPVSEWEIERNQVVYTYQGNRNPFIDHPELVALIWGDPEDYTD